jgi:hypothetical protein
MPAKLTLTSLAFATVIATFGASDARAQARMRFESMDQNRDGVITRAEWRGSDRSFRNHDWNGDGRLAGEEIRLGAQRNTNWEQADHAPNRYERFVSWTQAGFNNLDHNRDRRITGDEWHFDRETFRRVDRNRDGALDEAEFIGVDRDDDRGDNFDDLDMNNNGRIERSEWHASDAAFDHLDQNRDNHLSRFEVAGGVEWNDDRWDEFAGLDYDRNNTISREEWHWSLASFRQRDRNRDGVLSRQEFEASGGVPGVTGTSGGVRTVRVNSQQRWTDSGVTVRAGQTYAITATGSITMSDNPQDTASPAGSTTGRRANDAPILNQSAGSLIAIIDNYGPIHLGDRRSFTAPVNGRLYLGVNDDHLPDNRGEYIVEIRTQ